jgi:hypothetical protein
MHAHTHAIKHARVHKHMHAQGLRLAVGEEGKISKPSWNAEILRLKRFDSNLSKDIFKTSFEKKKTQQFRSYTVSKSLISS